MTRPTMSPRFTSSRPCRWSNPRPRDARHMTHGVIYPMDEERRGLFGWFFRRSA